MISSPQRDHHLGGGICKGANDVEVDDLENLILLDNSNWENHIPKCPIFDEELQIEDDDGS